MSLARSKAAGELVEGHVMEIVPELEAAGARDEWRDARTTTALVPREKLPAVGICLLERGTPVEIKSCMVVATEAQSRGRFYLRAEQHGRLLEERGAYLFAVATPDPSRDVLALKIAAASTVDGIVGDGALISWIDPGDRPTYAQISWSRLFAESELSAVPLE